MLRKKTTLMVIVALIGVGATIGCKESEAVKAKSGAQLWAENCQRCHNLPDPSTFSDEQWSILVMHMQTRALLTNNERDKIYTFMRQFNR